MKVGRSYFGDGNTTYPSKGCLCSAMGQKHGKLRKMYTEPTPNEVKIYIYILGFMPDQEETNTYGSKLNNFIINTAVL